MCLPFCNYLNRGNVDCTKPPCPRTDASLKEGRSADGPTM